MRQTCAESREIDQMMRQWNPAKQTLARAGVVARTAVLVLLAAGAHPALADTPVQTRTTLTITSHQTGPVTETVLSAHVTDATGHPLPDVGGAGAGAVSFEVGTSSLGSSIVDAEGNAVLSVTSLPAAPQGPRLAIHAVYQPASAAAGLATGSGLVAGSVSAAATVDADASAVPDFSITAAPTTVTAKQGQYATTILTVTPSNGFSEQVSLSCANLPAQVTCNFSPVIATTANGAFTSTLELQTQTASGALTPLDPSQGTQAAYAWLLPGACALAGFAVLRRRALRRLPARYLGMLGLILLGLGSLGGCSARYGYIHHPPIATSGTPLGSYTIGIDAAGNAGGTVTPHSTSIVLQVQ